VPVGGSFLCTGRSFSEAGATLERMREAGIRHHYAFNRINPSGHATERLADLMPTRSEVLAALGQAEAFACAHDVTLHCTMPIPHCMVDEAEFPHIGFGECSAGTDAAEYAVDSQGRLKLCPLQQQAIGSLWERSLSDLVADEAVAAFRNAVPGFCRDCPHATNCRGGCGAAAEWAFGTASEIDPFLAQHVMLDFPLRARIVEEEGGKAGRSEETEPDED
jgi:radical SAM protein with 4Fe4S-binding SPASM domain